MEGLLVYPNKMDFPIMENFGKPPTPLGMLEVVIKSAEGLPNADFMGLSDPFVEVRPRPPAQHSALSAGVRGQAVPRRGAAGSRVLLSRAQA